MYRYLDESELFQATAREDSRSLMNVCFVTGDEARDKEFISAATKAGFDGLKVTAAWAACGPASTTPSRRKE
ncbi:MAG: hypothetical protein R3B90_17980 [Planctomycetaceae bacterium]